MSIFYYVVAIIVVIIVIVCAIVVCRLNTVEEKIGVEAIVTSKELQQGGTMVYLPSSTRDDASNFFIPEQYIVVIEYGSYTRRYSDKILFNLVEEGDKLIAVLYRRYNRKHELLEEKLMLPYELS